MLLNPAQKISDLQQKVINELLYIFDPEIPVNIYELGLIYDIIEEENQIVTIRMTLTSPNCPEIDTMLNEIYMRVKNIEEIEEVKLDVVFDPPWSIERMTDEAKLMLGWL